MIITKLHALLLLLFLGGSIGVAVFLKTERPFPTPQIEKEKPVAPQPVEVTPTKPLSPPASPVLIEASQPLETVPLVQKPSVVSEIKVKKEPPKEEKQTTSPVFYTVQPGDTLWKIAEQKKYFGDGYRWYDIWKANSQILPNYNDVEVGKQLLIPLDKPMNYVWPGSPRNERALLTEKKP